MNMEPPNPPPVGLRVRPGRPLELGASPMAPERPGVPGVLSERFPRRRTGGRDLFLSAQEGRNQRSAWKSTDL